MRFKDKMACFALLWMVLWFSVIPYVAWAQVSAAISGRVNDVSGAAVPGANVTVTSLETGATRSAVTDEAGNYKVLSLPVGRYEVKAEKPGFKAALQRGIDLVVGQQAIVNLSLEVGNVEQQVTVTAEAPLVNTTLSSTSGLVGEKQVKDLPLNGRSYDQLLTLNAGIVNSSATYTRNGNFFSVAGRWADENRFLMNGVDYIGADYSGSVITPQGASGQVLGVDAIREFNVVQHTYGAEYGKRAGGQVSIVTSSGTNQLHGDAFEYLRNSALDSRNFFDYPLGGRIPPFKRNQFGGALGGPLKKDKAFLFGNYEGFRQRLGISNVAVVPDNLARQGYLPVGPNNSVIQTPNLKPGMLPFFAFWPEQNGPELGGGLAYNYSNPLQRIHEDFGLARFDYNASAKDSFSANYMVDKGESDTPNPDPIFIGLTPQSSQLLSMQETHVFSPTVLNVATLGFGRANSLTGNFPVTPMSASLSFITGFPPGTITIGGGAAGVTASTVTVAKGAANTHTVRNFFTWADDAHIIKGNHSLSAGLWIQRIQQNSLGTGVATSGSVTYPTLLTFLQDLPTQMLAVPNPTLLGFRTTEAAWYVQDEIKLKPNLTLRLGLRDEMTTGWNEAKGRAANYIFDPNGMIITDPLVGTSGLTQNNAIALWQPRVGLAWDPTGKATWAVRAGFGIYNDLQDNLGWKFISNPPFNARVTLTAPMLSYIPIRGGTQPPPSCNAQLQGAGRSCSVFQPGGVEPNLHTPTVQEWSLTLERSLASNIVLQLGYAGSQAYHLIAMVDANTARPLVCSDPQGCVSGGTLGPVGRASQGTTYMAPGGRPNPFVSYTQTYMYESNSSYHALNVSLVSRAARGLTFKANYTFSKVLDMNSGGNAKNQINEPQDILNIYNLKQSKGVAGYSLKHQFNVNFSYELPFGHGQRWGSGASSFVDKLISGWQWNGILTAQSGFPFSPLAGSNRSGTGDTQNPDVPDHNPAFTGPVILSNPNRWFDPHAFLLPVAGTFGNVARSSFIGPGLTTLDTSLFKKFSINERWSLQFRAESFNIFNHANFGIPNTVVFSGANISPSAGVITNTATTSRQMQLALKLLF